MENAIKRGFLVLLTIVLAACATNTRITNAWRDSAYTGGRFQRVLVLGFGEDGATRRVFEDRFVGALRAAGVDAVASYTLVSGLTANDWPQVREALSRSRADAVLTSRLVAVDRRVQVQPAQAIVMPAFGYRRGLYGYYSSVVVTAPTTYAYDVVTLETNLWQATTESLVWSASSESFAPESARDTSAVSVGVIVGKLRDQGLL